jgi:hypothetical protein
MAKIALRISNVPVAQVIIAARKIQENMTVNAGPFATPPVLMATFLTQIDDLITAEQKTILGGVADRVSRDNALAIVEDSMKKLANYVQIESDGDHEIILSAGMDIAARGPKKYDTVPVPTELVTSLGNSMGEIKLRWKRGRTRLQFEVQWNVNPEAEDTWKLAHFTTSSRTKITDLPSGQDVWFRVRSYGTKGLVSDWSTPVKQRVL